MKKSDSRKWLDLGLIGLLSKEWHILEMVRGRARNYGNLMKDVDYTMRIACRFKFMPWYVRGEGEYFHKGKFTSHL